MATILKTLIPLLSLITFLLAPAPARSQTTSFQYDFYGQKPTTLIYQGDAHFPNDTTYLRLTKTDDSGNPLKRSVGRAVYKTPVQFWRPGAQVDLETTVKFRIRTFTNDPADGLAFFIAPVGTQPGQSGSSLGVFEPGKDLSVFAVEFDTYVNSAFDPNYRHVGVDIRNVNSVNTTRVDAILNQDVTALIGYKEATKLITVSVTVNSITYKVSYVYDLSSVLDQQVQVGLSASTGDAIAVHDIISWYFTATLVQGATGSEEEDIKIQQYV